MTTGRLRVTRRGYRVAALVACAAVTMSFFVFGQGTTVPLWYAFALTAWWSCPLAFLLLDARTAVLFWGGAVAYLAAVALVLNSIYKSRSSTAGIGLTYVPVYLAIAVAVVLAVERAVDRGRP